MAHSTVKKLFSFYLLVYLLLVSDSESATLKLVRNSNVSEVYKMPVNKFDGVVDEKSNMTNASNNEALFDAINNAVKTIDELYLPEHLRKQSNEDYLPEPLEPSEPSTAHRVENRRNVVIESDFAVPFFKSYDRLSTFILNILFGMVFDRNNLSSIVKKPIGLFIGVFSKCFLVPLLSYALGLKIFAGNGHDQFDLLVTVIGLSGSLAVCWTATLRGNVDLSIILNVVNTILYFGMYPMWLLSLGRKILAGDDSASNIESSIDCHYIWPLLFELIPLCVGLVIQHFWPEIKDYTLTFLTYFSIYHITLHMCFGGIADGHDKFQIPRIKEFIQIAIILSVVVYSAVRVLASAFRQKFEDRFTIAIGSAILCTGIFNSTSLFLYSLPLFSSFPMWAHFIYIIFCPERKTIELNQSNHS